MKSDSLKIPEYSKLVEVTYAALKSLGGSGKNNEINDKAVEILNLSDDVCSVPHLNSSSLSEINYRLAWARTLLKNYGAIENSARSVWSITADFSDISAVDGEYIERNCKKASFVAARQENSEEAQMEEAGVEVPEEVRPWRTKLHKVLIQMNAYAFERLTQRLLRESGFNDVQVTKKIR